LTTLLITLILLIAVWYFAVLPWLRITDFHYAFRHWPLRRHFSHYWLITD
jgi:hypothetical protein